MKRAGAALLGCAAACSIYGADDPEKLAPAPAIDSGTDGSLDTLDGGDGGAIDLENVVEDASTSDATVSDATVDHTTPSLPDLYVFVTSKKISAKIGFGAVEATADGICNDLALGKPKINSHKFKAWIGILSTPENRILKQAAGHRYILLNGDLVMNDPSAVPPTILTPIVLDENGIKVTLVDHVWTGINDDGTASTSSCDFWSSESHDNLALIGAFIGTDTWTSYSVDRCDTLNHLYCFEVP